MPDLYVLPNQSADELSRRADDVGDALDRINVVAALLQPFCPDGGESAYKGRDRQWLTEEGYRALPAVVRAIDDAVAFVNAMEDDDVLLVTLEALVPLRWAVYALGGMWTTEETGLEAPQNTAQILEFAFDQVRHLADDVREVAGSLRTQCQTVALAEVTHV